MSINFMKVHQPNMPHPDYIHKSLSKSKYADSVVELDARIGRIMDKIRALGLRQEHARLLHDRQRRLAGRLSRRRLHAVPRHQGHRPRRRQPRPGDRLVPGKIAAGAKNHEIVGGLDLMATFAAVAGVKLPEQDREGQPIIFDSYDMSPVLFGTGKSPRKAWFYFTENELTPGRRARRQLQGGVQPARRRRCQPPAASRSTPTWAGRGRRSTSRPCPQVFDLWQDPQERYDIFMNNYTERTWTGHDQRGGSRPSMKTYVAVPPPRKLQSEATPARSRSRIRALPGRARERSPRKAHLPMPTGN